MVIPDDARELFKKVERLDMIRDEKQKIECELRYATHDVTNIAMSMIRDGSLPIECVTFNERKFRTWFHRSH